MRAAHAVFLILLASPAFAQLPPELLVAKTLGYRQAASDGVEPLRPSIHVRATFFPAIPSSSTVLLSNASGIITLA